MSDVPFRNRPALGGGVTLAPLTDGHVVMLLTRVGAAVPEASGLRAAGPGQWLMVGDAPLRPQDLADLGDRLPDVAVSDQSHGRVRIAVSGDKAAALLAKGTAVDLDALPAGQSVTTLVGQIGVHLTRIGEASFELIVLRSFASALWHDLEAMAAGY